MPSLVLPGAEPLRVAVLLLSALVCASVLCCGGVSGAAPVSFCDKYSQALFNSTDGEAETKLITAVVTRAVLGDSTVNPPVPGLVGAGSPILQVSSAATPYQPGNVHSMCVSHARPCCPCGACG